MINGPGWYQGGGCRSSSANEPFVSEAPPLDRAIPDGDVVAVVYALLSKWQPIGEAGGDSS